MMKEDCYLYKCNKKLTIYKTRFGIVYEKE
nr:MAG TPA: hypothetical protein [Caudoviricetes sp.]DAO53554.1 MAG TPA: hypothetical protein [Caudoviricetes sp.]